MQDAGLEKWLSAQKHLQCKLDDEFDSQNQHTMPHLVACISNPNIPAMRWEADTEEGLSHMAWVCSAAENREILIQQCKKADA